MSELRVTKLPSYANEIGLKLPLRNSVGGLLRTYESYCVYFLKPVWLRCFKGPAKVRDRAVLVFFQDAFGTYFYKAPNRTIGYSFESYWNRVKTIHDHDGNLIYHQQHSIEYKTDRDGDNPVVKCPVCGYMAPLYDGFSLLESGFNGIKTGDPDDLGQQECGHCKAKLNWD